MATQTKGTAIAQVAPRSRGAVVSKRSFEELKERSRAATKRLREATEDDQDAMISLGSAVALGLYEKSGRKLPTVMGLDSAVTVGMAAYLATRKSKNKTARMVRQAGIALATIGANRSTMRGSLKVAGEDDEDEDSDL